MSELQNKKQSKYWCFTVNNYSEEELCDLQTTFRNVDIVTYGIIAREKGEMGTPHLQGYVEFKHRKGLGGVKDTGKGFARAHLEIRRGTRNQAISYCQKDRNFDEYGRHVEETAPAKITKEELRELALEGGSRAVANDPRATLHNIRTARILLEEIEPPRSADEPIIVHWYFGKTGIGKSRRARFEAELEFGQDEVYRKADPSKWFNGYDRHKAVIIDDFRDSWWYFTEILRLLDRYPTQVEVKGGMRQWVPRKIWVTSAHSPRSMYSGVGEDIQQLVRRCTKIEEIVFPWIPMDIDSDADTVLCDEAGRPLARSNSNITVVSL